MFPAWDRTTATNILKNQSLIPDNACLQGKRLEILYLKKLSRLQNVSQDLWLTLVLCMAIQWHSLQAFQSKVQEVYRGEFGRNLYYKLHHL